MIYPISSTDREKEIAGNSNATSSQFMRPKEANKLVNGDCASKYMRRKEKIYL